MMWTGAESGMKAYNINYTIVRETYKPQKYYEKRYIRQGAYSKEEALLRLGASLYKHDNTYTIIKIIDINIKVEK